MTAVNVRIRANFWGEQDLTDGTTVVGNIYPAERRSGGKRDILIPVGLEVSPSTFELEPGGYVIEAIMPSGVILTEEVTVEEGQTLPVDLQAVDSPYETHSWQYLAGNLEPAAEYHSPRKIPTPRSYGSRVLSYQELDSDEAPAEGEDTIPPEAQVWWIPDSRQEGWSIPNLNEFARGSPIADIGEVTALFSEGPLVPLQAPTTSDGLSHLYRFDRSGPVGLNDKSYQGARQFVLIRSGADVFLVTLPAPWMDVRGNDVQVEVMVSTRQNPTGSSLTVAVRDVVLGPALAYLGKGALSAAATMFENVEELLYGKMMNQLAAAAGAYVLVGTDIGSEPRNWHPWVQHLSEWFGWLPDGSILWGTMQLRTARTADEVARARETLKAAFGRGVPVFTLGLRWLIDGLSEFEDDGECEAMLKQARELSWRVDTRQPFVIIRLNGRRK